MYDLRPLEEEWKRYKQKKRKPWYIASAIFLLFIFLFFLNNSKINLNTLSDYLKTFKISISSIEEKNNSVDFVKSTFVMNASLMKIEVEKELAQAEKESEDENPTNILVDIPILDGKEEIRSNKSSKKRVKMHLDIIKTSNITAYKDVEKRFKQSHDTDDSLFLARSYYKKGKYKKSEYWALQTNKVNPNIEESMLLFVKSKMKLGRKYEARNILTKYVKNSNSQAGKKLLDRIENGKF